MRELFLQQREEELNEFLSFIISKPDLFNNVASRVFFSDTTSESQVQDQLLKIKLLNFKQILIKYQNFYPQFRERTYNKENKKKLQEAMVHIEKQIFFYEELLDVLR